MRIYRNGFESAKRTIGNSPAIYRWGRFVSLKAKSAKRTAEILLSGRFIFSRPLHGLLHGTYAGPPALKCWAIFMRPHRGLCASVFRRPACLLFAFFLQLSAYCLLTRAQPGMPQASSPLYGARPESGPVAAGLPKALQKVGIDQKLNEQIPLDAIFKDEQGREVRLDQFFDKKPVVLSLVYYDCPMLCTQVLNGMTSSFRQVSFTIGQEFEVVTVSFDPRETPQLAAAKKQTYLQRYGRAGAEAGWHFLTGDEPNIRRLTAAVGFRYVWDEQTNQFAHASGIMVLTPEGKLARYFYGIDYAPKDLRLGLVEASQNEIGTPVDALMLYCYHYDPATGKYGAVVMNIMRLAGIVTLALIGGLLLMLRKRSRREPLRRDSGAVARP
jgi:protein SCO1/2